VVFLPTILGVTVIGLIFTLMFNPSAGPAQQLWAAFGTSSAFFGDPNLAMALVILVQVWSGIGVAVVIYLAGLQAIPPELYEVADIDGATSGRVTRAPSPAVTEAVRQAELPILQPMRPLELARQRLRRFQVVRVQAPYRDTVGQWAAHCRKRSLWSENVVGHKAFLQNVKGGLGKMMLGAGAGGLYDLGAGRGRWKNGTKRLEPAVLRRNAAFAPRITATTAADAA
jgi:hypothetical protein